MQVVTEKPTVKYREVREACEYDGMRVVSIEHENGNVTFDEHSAVSVATEINRLLGRRNVWNKIFKTVNWSILEEPAEVDVKVEKGGKHDGADIVLVDTKQCAFRMTKNAALDTAYGIFHVASEPCPQCQYSESRIDWKTAFSGFLLVSCLTMYAFLLWQGLNLFF